MLNLNLHLMKSFKITILLVLSLLLVCCDNASKKNAGLASEKANSSSVEVKETEDTPIDLKCFGLTGDVREVIVTIHDISPDGDGASWQDNAENMEFDRSGKVLKDRFDNIYKYDDNGVFISGVSDKSKMQRDNKGRIVFYENRMDEEDDEGYAINFEYDDNDRMSKVEFSGWEATVEHIYTYESGHIYPDRVNWESDDQGDHYSTVITYTYKKFDDKGNWTEREAKTVCKYTNVDSPEVETTESINLEQRQINYY